MDQDAIYGADRVDVIGIDEVEGKTKTQHKQGYFITAGGDRPIAYRFVDKLSGYMPLGYFQLWHGKNQKPYPYSLGTAAHDDLMFSMLWPTSHRRLLPSVICYHVCAQEPKVGENWDGKRKQPRLKHNK